jgi:hypothetical protein
MSEPPRRPRLAAVRLADDAPTWEGLGFAGPWLGGTLVELGAAAPSYVLDDAPPPPRTDATPHPNGALGVDHVVVTTPDLDATVARLEAGGLPCRRVREAGERRQAFFVLADALLEVVGPAGGEEAMWGLTVVVADADALASELGDRVGEVRDAVQPGRRIVTARGTATPLAFITPRR